MGKVCKNSKAQVEKPAFNTARTDVFGQRIVVNMMSNLNSDPLLTGLEDFAVNCSLNAASVRDGASGASSFSVHQSESSNE